MTKSEEAAEESARRLLRLLWRDDGANPAPRGRPSTLTVAQLIEEAIRLADEAGLEALTIRKLASRLGRAPMALYTYIASKDELQTLMLDAVYRAMKVGKPADPGWRAAVETVAKDNYALHLQHPWTLDLPLSRPPLGPGLIAKYDRELASFSGTGLSAVQTDSALTFVLSFVAGAAREAVKTQRTALDSALSDAAWWEIHEPYFLKMFEPGRYPLAASIGAEAGAASRGAYNPEQAFAFGLSCLLDGLDALIASGSDAMAGRNAPPE